MTRLFFLIRSLGMGGAERQLVELVKALDKDQFAITVATFYSGGAFRSELDGLQGVRVVSLDKRGRWDVFPFIWRLWRAARRFRPDIMYSIMGVANELSLLVGRAVGAKVVWSLRASNVDFSHYGRLSLWSFRLGAWLSRFPDLIIANSFAGKQHHGAHHYSRKRMLVIPNGVDTDTFRPQPEAGMRVRREWGIGEDRQLIGVVGRLDPMKDHTTFLRAAALLAGRHGSTRFVCVGGGSHQYGSELRSLVSDLELDGKVIWAGARSDMPAVYNALDLACSSSLGEGLPNAIAEAMACGVPCVVTDVGDSARLIGMQNVITNYNPQSAIRNPQSVIGTVVPPGDPQAMAAAWVSLLSLPPDERSSMGREARERILREYSVSQLAQRTRDALLRLVS